MLLMGLILATICKNQSIHRTAVSCTSTESTGIPTSTNSSPLETINVIFLVPSAPQSNTQQQCHRKPPADSIPSSLTRTLGQACHQLDRTPPEGHITILRQGLPSRHSSQLSVSTGPTAHPGCCWGGTRAFKSGQGMGKADPCSKQTLPCAALPALSGPGSTPPGPHLCFQTATGTVGRTPSLQLPPVSLTWLVPLTHTCPCHGERGPALCHATPRHCTCTGHKSRRRACPRVPCGELRPQSPFFLSWTKFLKD